MAMDKNVSQISDFSYGGIVFSSNDQTALDIHQRSEDIVQRKQVAKESWRSWSGSGKENQSHHSQSQSYSGSSNGSAKRSIISSAWKGSSKNRQHSSQSSPPVQILSNTSQNNQKDSHQQKKSNRVVSSSSSSSGIPTSQNARTTQTNEPGRRNTPVRMFQNHSKLSTGAVAPGFNLALTENEAKALLGSPNDGGRFGLVEQLNNTAPSQPAAPNTMASMIMHSKNSSSYHQSTLQFDKRIKTSKCFNSASSRIFEQKQDEPSLTPPPPSKPNNNDNSKNKSLLGGEARTACFESGPWVTLCSVYGANPIPNKDGNTLTETYNIGKILNNELTNLRKIPYMGVVVSKIRFLEHGALALLADPSGEMQSEVHALVLKKKDEYEFVEGAAMMLRDFTVFRSHLNREGYATHSVIITPKNVAKFFPPETPFPEVDEATREEKVLADWLDANERESQENAQLAEEEERKPVAASTATRENPPFKTKRTIKTTSPENLVDEMDTTPRKKSNTTTTFIGGAGDKMEITPRKPSSNSKFSTESFPKPKPAPVEVADAKLPEHEKQANTISKSSACNHESWLDDEDDDELDDLFN